MQINAAVVESADGPFTIETVELASPGPHEVLVEIKGVGLCHTDLGAKSGIYGMPYPMVLGHEGSGIVREVGSAVSCLAVGDQVALSFSSCGQCTPCAGGHPANCTQFTQENYIGTRPDGSGTITRSGGELAGHFFGQSSFATYALANERNAVKVETSLDIALLGPLGCGIQTGAGAVMRSFAAEPGSTLLVLGGGSVGLSAVMGGVVRGCSTIVVVDPLEPRRQLALELGATAVIDPSAGPLDDALATALPKGADYVFDTTGRVEVIQAGVSVAAARGTVGLVGVPADFSVEMPVSIIGLMVKGLKIMGIVEGDSDPQTFIPELLGLQAEGRFPFERLIETYPLESINQAVEDQERGKVTKVVLVPSSHVTSSQVPS